MTVYGIDRQRLLRGPKEGATIPDILTDFEAGKGELISKIQRMAKVPDEALTHVHASLNCGPESTLNRIEATQGPHRGKRPHAGIQREASQEVSVTAVVDGITEKAAKGHKFTYMYTVEQPTQGSLKDHPGLLSLPRVR